MGYFFVAVGIIFIIAVIKYLDPPNEMVQEIKPKKNEKASRSKVLKRKIYLIDQIQKSCIKFAGIYYLYCRTPLGIASEKYYENGKPEEMNSYIVLFKDTQSNIFITFTAQIRANMVEITKDGNELLSFVDQTLQHPSIFSGPGDVMNKCNSKQLKEILKVLDRIHEQYIFNYVGKQNVS